MSTKAGRVIYELGGGFAEFDGESNFVSRGWK